ncbi:methylornithine synthase PylB [Dehalobacterium formicoaceticum]
MSTHRARYLEQILEKAYQEITLSKKEITYLLGLKQGEEMNQVFQMAETLRQRYFGDKIFMYGFVYFSTYCQKDCAFCLYRKSNHSLQRYRKSEAEILEIACSLKESGVHLLDLTMGEDPQYLCRDQEGVDKLCGVIEKVKKNTGLPLMVSPGVVSGTVLKRFRDIGVNWYALYQETHTRSLYAKLRLQQDYDQRLQAKKTAHQIGMLIEEGLLTGIGDQGEDVVNSLLVMEDLRAEQVRVMSFIPQERTPMENWFSPPRVRESLIIAIMRIMFPDRLIPASLDVDGINGLKQRLAAGANVVTSIIPSQSGLAGVSNSDLDIEDGNRTVYRVTNILEELNLAPASLDEYMYWLDQRTSLVRPELDYGRELLG